MRGVPTMAKLVSTSYNPTLASSRDLPSTVNAGRWEGLSGLPSAGKFLSFGSFFFLGRSASRRSRSRASKAGFCGVLACSAGRLRVTSNERGATATSSIASVEDFIDEQDYIKSGGTDIELVRMQSNKTLNQTKIADALKTLSSVDTFDLIVIGCGPAGLSIAGESAKQGLTVGLIGPDLPFVNNYGIWLDEFKAIGLDHCVEQIWKDTAIYIDNDSPILIGREYGRVSRELLHDELVNRCASAGVFYLDAEVTSIANMDDGDGSLVYCHNGDIVKSRLVTVATGAASGKFLNYEKSSKGVGIQTAYGIEVEVENYLYDPSIMHFMDYRHFWDNSNSKYDDEFTDIPSFLYAMPMSSTRIFFEETCLAARPAMPFEVLKQRLIKRLNFLGLKYNTLHEEEWSYIPVGGSLPIVNQKHIGFGAAASMIHPATGYSITRSLTEAPFFATAISNALRQQLSVSPSPSQSSTNAIAIQAWQSLWSLERRRQRAFMLFGLELILQLDLNATRDFFNTFFKLPEWLWRGFLASNLTSIDLIWFALVTFAIAPNNLRFRLVKHLVTDPSGEFLVRTYAGLETKPL